jgi:hypothetical protein
MLMTLTVRSCSPSTPFCINRSLDSLDEEAFLEPKDEFHSSLDGDTEGAHAPWQYRVQYVYDAAAERTEQRIREAKLVNLVNGVH